MRYCQGDEKENAIMFALLELCSNIHVTMPHVDLHSRKMCQMRNFYARVVAAREFLQSRSAIGCIGDILHALGSTTPQYPRPPCNSIFTAHCGTNLPLSDARSMTSLRRRSSHVNSLLGSQPTIVRHTILASLFASSTSKSSLNVQCSNGSDGNCDCGDYKLNSSHHLKMNLNSCTPSITHQSIQPPASLLISVSLLRRWSFDELTHNDYCFASPRDWKTVLRQFPLRFCASRRPRREEDTTMVNHGSNYNWTSVGSSRYSSSAQRLNRDRAFEDSIDGILRDDCRPVGDWCSSLLQLILDRNALSNSIRVEKQIKRENCAESFVKIQDVKTEVYSSEDPITFKWSRTGEDKEDKHSADHLIVDFNQAEETRNILASLVLSDFTTNEWKLDKKNEGTTRLLEVNLPHQDALQLPRGRAIPNTTFGQRLKSLCRSQQSDNSKYPIPLKLSWRPGTSRPLVWAASRIWLDTADAPLFSSSSSWPAFARNSTDSARKRAFRASDISKFRTDLEIDESGGNPTEGEVEVDMFGRHPEGEAEGSALKRRNLTEQSSSGKSIQGNNCLLPPFIASEASRIFPLLKGLDRIGAGAMQTPQARKIVSDANNLLEAASKADRNVKLGKTDNANRVSSNKVRVLAEGAFTNKILRIVLLPPSTFCQNEDSATQIQSLAIRPSVTSTNQSSQSLLPGLGLADRSDTVLVTICKTFITGDSGRDVVASFVRFALLRKALSLRKPASRLFIAAITHIAFHRPLTIVSDLLLPLLCRPSDEVGSAHCELTIQLLKLRSLSPPAIDLLVMELSAHPRHERLDSDEYDTVRNNCIQERDQQKDSNYVDIGSIEHFVMHHINVKKKMYCMWTDLTLPVITTALLELSNSRELACKGQQQQQNIQQQSISCDRIDSSIGRCFASPKPLQIRTVAMIIQKLAAVVGKSSNGSDAHSYSKHSSIGVGRAPTKQLLSLRGSAKLASMVHTLVTRHGKLLIEAEAAEAKGRIGEFDLGIIDSLRRSIGKLESFMARVSLAALERIIMAS